MELAPGQERHCILGACRHHKYNQRSHLKLSQLATLSGLRTPEKKLFNRCFFVSSNIHLPLFFTPFYSSSSGWSCRMNWSELSWDCAAGAASCTRATDKAAHILMLLLYTCTVAIMEPCMFCCLVLIGVQPLTEEFF